MTEDQKQLSNIFGWTAVGVICLTAAKFLTFFFTWVKLQFVNDYDVSD
jgi:hypothetical protein